MKNSVEETTKMTMKNALKKALKTKRIEHYRKKQTMHSEGDIWKMPMKGCINDQESLIRLKNGYIEGLKKINEENVVMKHGLSLCVKEG